MVQVLRPASGPASDTNTECDARTRALPAAGSTDSTENCAQPRCESRFM